MKAGYAKCIPHFSLKTLAHLRFIRYNVCIRYIYAGRFAAVLAVSTGKESGSKAIYVHQKRNPQGGE